MSPNKRGARVTRYISRAMYLAKRAYFRHRTPDQSWPSPHRATTNQWRLTNRPLKLQAPVGICSLDPIRCLAYPQAWRPGWRCAVAPVTTDIAESQRIRPTAWVADRRFLPATDSPSLARCAVGGTPPRGHSGQGTLARNPGPQSELPFHVVGRANPPYLLRTAGGTAACPVAGAPHELAAVCA